MKRFATLLLALAILFSLAVPAMALEVDTQQNGKATITVSNAAKGETYSIYKLFESTVTTTQDGSISYTGTIPDSLKEYFTADAAGNITATEAAENESGNLSANAVAAMTAWAKTQTAIQSQVADGSVLTFTGLQYGLYVITTTQGSAISVDSTNPNATVFDKNSTTVQVTKSIDDDDVYIGQTVTYTATFATTNYLMDTNGKPHKVVEYVIDDTLPDFLSDVKVTSLTIDNDPGKTDDAIINITVKNNEGQDVVPQFDTNKKITLPWTAVTTAEDGTVTYGNHLYNNGALITLTYTAKVTDQATVDGAGNTNTVNLTAYTENPDDEDKKEPWEDNDQWKASETFWTYAAALKKVSKEGEKVAPLAGAKFKAKGLTVEGSNGKYTVIAYDDSESAALGTEMETDDQGNLVILGLQSDKVTTGEGESAVTAPTFKLTVTETEAPAGYNKLVETFTLPTSIIGETITVTTNTTTIYYDENGNVVTEETDSYTTTTVVDYNDKLEALAFKVVNQKGLELPETGGMGTTLFYVVGAGLMLAAIVLLVAKKRAAN